MTVVDIILEHAGDGQLVDHGSNMDAGCCTDTEVEWCSWTTSCSSWRLDSTHLAVEDMPLLRKISYRKKKERKVGREKILRSLCFERNKQSTNLKIREMPGQKGNISGNYMQACAGQNSENLSHIMPFLEMTAQGWKVDLIRQDREGEQQ